MLFIGFYQVVLLQNLCGKNKSLISNREFSDWRFDLKLYCNLDTYRTVVLNIELCTWWSIAHKYFYLKRSCITMMKLLCNTNCLRLYSEHDILPSERICKLCRSNVVESNYHFIMECSAYTSLRSELFNNIHTILSNESFINYRSLSDKMIFYILLGLDYPFERGELEAIRCCSAYYLHKMYCIRYHAL